MTRPNKPWLNWRRERKILSPILERQAGVISVRASANGPLIEFCSALRSHLEHSKWRRPWRTVQFDPENSNTRYFGEMTRQVERTLGLPADANPHLSLGDGTKIASDLQAGAISINNSFNFERDEYDQSVVQERRAQRIIGALQAKKNDEAFCFFFINSHQFRRHDLVAFKTHLWLGGVAKLVDESVLLVDCTRTGPYADGSWPPEPNVSIHLPDEYDEQSRTHAVDDLADFLYQEGQERSLLEAKAYSRGMVDNHRNPATLYAQLGAVLAGRKQ